jgi:enoyl-CoA hydratase/carnithine racemase
VNPPPDDVAPAASGPLDGVAVVAPAADAAAPGSAARRVRGAAGAPGVHALLLIVEPTHDGVADPWSEELVLAVSDVSVPVVALLRGPVRGWAAAVALVADLRVAADDVVLRVDPLVGATSTTLPRVVPGGVARRLLLDPADLPAAEALDLGLLHEVVPGGEAVGAARATAARVARVPGRGAAVLRALAARDDAVAAGLAEEARLRAVVDLHRRT